MDTKWFGGVFLSQYLLVSKSYNNSITTGAHSVGKIDNAITEVLESRNWERKKKKRKSPHFGKLIFGKFLFLGRGASSAKGPPKAQGDGE